MPFLQRYHYPRLLKATAAAVVYPERSFIAIFKIHIA